MLTNARYVVNDARNTVHDLLRQMKGEHPRSIQMLSNGSTASTSSVTSDSLFESLKNKWDINLQMYEEVVSESSGLSVAIISAINEKNCKMVAELLKSGEDPLAKGGSGWCVFHYAVRADSKTVMRELLKSKKVKENRGFNIRDTHGDTALHFAALLGMKKMARELLIAGSDRNALNNSGYSPLSVAVKEKETSIVEVLLDYKAECIPPNPKKLKVILEEIKYIKTKRLACGKVGKKKSRVRLPRGCNCHPMESLKFCNTAVHKTTLGAHETLVRAALYTPMYGGTGFCVLDPPLQMAVCFCCPPEENLGEMRII